MSEIFTKQTSQSEHEFLQTLLDNLPVALFCKDVRNEFRFAMWNKKAEHLFGLSLNDVIGKNDYDFFPKEQADFFRAKDIETVNAGESLEILEEPIDTKLYGRRILHTIKVTVKDAAGLPQYLLGISTDITEKKHQDELISQQHLQIIAASKMSALGEMAAGMAHEINNPLTIIFGKAQQMRLSLEKGLMDKDKLLQGVIKVETTAARIAKIIRGLKLFSRSSDQSDFAEINLKSVFEDTLEFCHERFKNHGVNLSIDNTSNKRVYCINTQISQVILNLLNNAFDAVKTLPNKWVKVECSDDDDHAVIAVVDSGPGIPEHIVEKLMQPFFTTKDVGEGTGLGLSISKGIIEDHGGVLFYDRTHSHTRFVIHLPYTKVKLRPKVA